ncbi:unnamed protein product [Trichobilharzia szidati]|nr:unnamed protein product [Trichobilharzia szidati]
MLDEGFQSASLSSEISQGSSYNRAVDFEIGNDLSSGVVFSADFHKFDDLKNLLDSNKDAMKLGAMKRIIEMVAKGKDCSDLFPAVVKNVVSKDNEIRKLVYAFLTHYAEQEQDIALLSISTFQRALKDPNQLIRASALRVLSSIRIPLILPIVILAIQDASKDLSAYVRKTAAHAVLKVYSLDPSEKETLIEIIDRLLGDKTTVVIGSAVRAFEEVCPERLDLIHKHYLKLCNLIMDVDEWGQVIILTMLTRYARTQFPNPEKQSTTVNDDNGATSNGDSSTNQSDNDLKSTTVGGRDSSPKQTSDNNLSEAVAATYSMSEALPLLESDRCLLVNASRYLLHSHNSAVVMAASQLLFYMNCKDDYPSVVRALIRTLNCNREVQYVILSNIASLTIEHRNLFEPYLRTFFVYSTDSLQVKLLKLEILSSLITETSSSVILREFQHYVNSFDEEFVTATIQAIGRCASSVPQISDVCLGGLLRLMSRPKEKIMAECVVVLRKLLQMQTTDHKEIITHIAQLADTMTIPTALASILWLLGEFSHRVPKIAPDILRKMAKSFSQQEAVVKFQIINLAAKLCIVNPRQTHILAQYVFNLAKYDTNYDIRDKARFLRGLLFPQIITNPNVNGDDASVNSNQKSSVKSGSNNTNNNSSNNNLYLSKHLRKICLATKPAPIIKSQFEDKSNYRLGTLSHILHRRVSGYRDLSDWPTVPPDPWSRVVVTPTVSKVNDNGNDISGMNSPRSVNTNHSSNNNNNSNNNTNTNIFDEHRQKRQQKADRFGNLSLDDFFSETEDDDDDDEGEEQEEDDENKVVDGDEEGDEPTTAERKMKKRKVKDALSSFYDDDEEVASDEEFTSNDEENADDNSGTEEEEEADDDSDSDFDLEYLIRSKQLTSAQNPLKEQTSPSSPPSALKLKTNNTPSNDDNRNSLRRDDASLSQNLDNELQSISMKQDLNSWLNAQSSSNDSSDNDDDDNDGGVGDITAGIGDSGEKKITEQLIDFNDYESIEDNEKSVNSNSNMAPLTSNSSLLHSEDCSSDIQQSQTVLPSNLSDSLRQQQQLPQTTVECVDYPIQIIEKSPLWFTLTNPNPEDQLTIQLQYSRTIWPTNPKLIVIRLKLFNESTNVEFINIHFDLMNTIVGRLLLDANRIQSFEPIAHLKPQSSCTVQFGIDFSGFCDSIDLDLVYGILSNSSSLNTNEEIQKWRISLTPLATELLRPIDYLKEEKEYFVQRDRLISSQSFRHMHLKLKGHLNININSATNPTEYSRLLTANLLQHINVKYQFSKMYINCKRRLCTDFGCSDSTFLSRPTDDNSNGVSRYITVYLAGQTIADNQLCLIEFSWCCSPVNIKKYNEHEIISNIFCNSTNIFRKNLSTCIEKIILS